MRPGARVSLDTFHFKGRQRRIGSKQLELFINESEFPITGYIHYVSVCTLSSQEKAG